MRPSSGFADVFDQLFRKMGLKPQGCDACRNKALAFGVRVCRLRLPEHPDCKSWEKQQ